MTCISFTRDELCYRRSSKNSQNDLIYSPVHGNQTAQHQCQSSSAHASHFQQVCNVSVALSKLGYTNLVFIEAGAKLNRQYYREVLLMQELLPVICSIARDAFVFSKTVRQHIALMTWSSFCAVMCRQPTSMP